MDDDGGNGGKRRIDMVRVPSEPQYYDRIALLGRDAEEVFPSRSRAAAASAADAAAAALGARRFVSERELEGLRAKGGAAPPSSEAHPESSSGKPLAEVLRERAAAKAAAVEETWRQMKVGANRPLDADEVEFVNSALDAEELAAARALRREEEEMRAFSEAPPASKLGGTLVVRAKRKNKKNEQEEKEKEAEGDGERRPGGAAPPPPSKRRREREEEGDGEKSGDDDDDEGANESGDEGGNGLAGLLGGYGSDGSDSG